jgi:hypothetical protein
MSLSVPCGTGKLFVVTEFYITLWNSAIYLSREYNIYFKINYLDI